MVKYIVEEYNSNLFDYNESDTDDDDSLDENSSSVKTGLAVLKLYLTVKNLADLAPPNYLNENNSEYSLKRGLHDWFFHSVATWIDILRRRVIKLVKNSVSISNSNNPDSCDSADTLLSKIDGQTSKDIPISPSAVDTAQLFLEINKFWTSLGWQNPHQSYAIVRKILEELYGSLVYYAAQLLEVMKSQKPSFTDSRLDDSEIHTYMLKGCIEINNINYVKEHVEVLAAQLNISSIIDKIEITEAGAEANGDYEESIDTLRTEMQHQIEKVIKSIMHNCVKIASPKFQQMLLELSMEDLSISANKKKSVQRFKHLLDYIDNCLITLKENLENQNFRQLLTQFWEHIIGEINEQVKVGLGAGKTSDYFQQYKELIQHLYSLFWPREVNLEIKMQTPTAFESYEDLKSRLSYLESSLEDLKLEYYAQRYKRQQSTSTSNNEHGIVTIRACFVVQQSNIVVEILNARKLKSYDSNDLSDPYAMASFVPKEYFPTASSFTTKCHKETLFPLFEETFTFTVTEEERMKGYLMITLYDYDFLGRDELMGEALFPLTDISKVPNASDIESLPQLHLALCKPNESDQEFLQRFDDRVWDKEAVKFAKIEKDKMQ